LNALVEQRVQCGEANSSAIRSLHMSDEAFDELADAVAHVGVDDLSARVEDAPGPGSVDERPRALECPAILAHDFRVGCAGGHLHCNDRDGRERGESAQNRPSHTARGIARTV